MMVRLKDYLHAAENALKAGNATEHTHRPALKALLESIDFQVTATNEPKRIACGAPDYIITRNGLTIGYIEAKDVGKSLAETERTDPLKRYSGGCLAKDHRIDGENRSRRRPERWPLGGICFGYREKTL